MASTPVDSERVTPPPVLAGEDAKVAQAAASAQATTTESAPAVASAAPAVSIAPPVQSSATAVATNTSVATSSAILSSSSSSSSGSSDAAAVDGKVAAVSSVAPDAATEAATEAAAVAVSSAAAAAAIPGCTAAAAPSAIAVALAAEQKAIVGFEKSSKCTVPDNTQRQMRKQGVVTKEGTFSTNERTLVLFDDVLILCKPTRRPGVLEPRSLFSLDDIVVCEQVKEKCPLQNAFTLQSKVYSVEIGTASPQEREEWIDAIVAEARRVMIARDRRSGHTGSWHSLHEGTVFWSLVKGDLDALGKYFEAAGPAGSAAHNSLLKSRDAFGYSLMHLAVGAHQNDTKVMGFLLAHDVAPFLPGDEQSEIGTPLHLAALLANVGALDTLAERRNVQVDCMDAKRRTPLRLVCIEAIGVSSPMRRIAECIRALVRHGVDLDLKDGDDASILQVVVGRNNAFLARVLVDEGASLTPISVHGRSVLHSATLGDSFDCVKVCIEAGSPPNMRDCNLNTPLHFARTLNVGQYLVAHGARPDLTNRDGLQAGAAFADPNPRDRAALQPPITSALQRWAAAPQLLNVVTEYGTMAPNHWLADSVSDSCLCCNQQFSFTRRRHHCRVCGILACHACSSKTFIMRGKTEVMRTCDGCYNQMKAKAAERLMQVAEEKKRSAVAAAASSSSSAASAAYAASASSSPSAAAASSPSSPSSSSSSSSSSSVSQASSSDSAARSALLAGAPSANARPAAAPAGAAPAENAQRQTAGVQSTMQDTQRAARERGEKLGELEERSGRLEQNTGRFADLAAQLKKKQESSWF